MNDCFSAPMLTTNSNKSMNPGWSTYTSSSIRTFSRTVSKHTSPATAVSNSSATAPESTFNAVSSEVRRAICWALLSAWEIRLAAVGSSTNIFQLKTSMSKPSLKTLSRPSSQAATAAL